MATGPGRRAAIVGTGLVGASLGLALRDRGWHVTGRDASADRQARAQAIGALDAVGDDPDAEVVFVATPAAAVPAVARAALASGAVVTDVAGVKRTVVEEVAHPRFVGGHPMAGSEQDGVEGADPRLFDGAVWVLTPRLDTDPAAYTLVRAVVGTLGAEVLALPPERHDELVATVSHVPHLTAAALMVLADEGAEEHAALLRLAAGGFRDMTRIASGNPAIWPDICAQNREAILGGLDRLASALGDLRRAVAGGDRGMLLDVLDRARTARRSLPQPAARPEELAELRLVVADRPGVLAEVTTVLGEHDVNIADIEIAHSLDGPGGVLVVIVPAAALARATDALAARGYRPAARALDP